MMIRVLRLPRPGETVAGSRFAPAPGGKGANQALAAARAGGDVTFIARVGGDSLAQQALAGLISAGIKVDRVSKSFRHPTGVALIMVGAHGQNCIAVAPGANAALTAANIRGSATAFRGAGALLLQMETPPGTVEAAARMASSRGIPVILNPAPSDRITDALLRHISVLTPNQSEAAALTGLRVDGFTAARTAAARLGARGPKAVIITLGARGALVWTGKKCEIVPGCEVEPVDTTAAGDVFNGALAVALGEGRPLIEAARFANAAAAISVTRSGSQSSAPTRAEIENFLNHGYSISTPQRSAIRGRVNANKHGAQPKLL